MQFCHDVSLALDDRVVVVEQPSTETGSRNGCVSVQGKETREVLGAELIFLLLLIWVESGDC